MAGKKVFIGPKLREMRQSRKLTQAEFASELGVSASYVNLIERNQRPASLKFLITLSDSFGLNWRDLVNDDSGLVLSDLRQVTKDAAFGDTVPDIEELRSAIEYSPNLMRGVMNIYNAYRTYGERLAEQSEFLSGDGDATLGVEQSAHDFFRTNNNYFDELEKAAQSCIGRPVAEIEDLHGFLLNYVQEKLNVRVKRVRDEVLGRALRYFDRNENTLFLSDGLDYMNRIFQIAHMIALIEFPDLINEQIPPALLKQEQIASRYRIELANYFAAAMMMPYEEFYEEAVASRYDIDRLAARFSVSYEQVCQRLTTMQRPGKRGIPFFFLRVDRGGNVSKRFNVTPIQLARYGGACPKLNVHYSFRVPGRILIQTVEMPDHSRYLTVNRTVDRPSIRYSTEDKRLAVCLGCPVEYAPDIVYGKATDPNMVQLVTEVGVNCRLCPRKNCEQRAHDPFHTTLEIDEDRRGVTHFES
ncbi:MAG: short-chain fatty acyl-CoA regulator family protein [Rhizobiaceae bacterium]|nr:short-chain fatty acyl-CoA regulator family protein [Rhizobiaceae bacterium]